MLLFGVCISGRNKIIIFGVCISGRNKIIIFGVCISGRNKIIIFGVCISGRNKIILFEWGSIRGKSRLKFPLQLKKYERGKKLVFEMKNR